MEYMKKYQEAAALGLLSDLTQVPVATRDLFCPRCRTNNANHHKHPLNHDASGGVVLCPECDYRAGFREYVRAALFLVESFPPVDVVYLKDSTSPSEEEVGEGDITVDDAELV